MLFIILEIYLVVGFIISNNTLPLLDTNVLDDSKEMGEIQVQICYREVNRLSG